MQLWTRERRPALSPLELFIREYLDKTGGVWEEVEPQLYDVVLPEGAELPAGRGSENGILKLAFDPEALPEHPTSQLASFGTPLVDRLLHDAIQRGRAGQFYIVGMNLQPHDLLGRVRRSLNLGSASIQIERMRGLFFPQVVFWFQAAFASDQKEQIILPIAIDLHYGREVRHIDRLLEPAQLAERPSPPLPPARSLKLLTGYQLARAQILRSVAAMANSRGRELSERCDSQVIRLRRYYADLRDELEEQKKRAECGRSLRAACRTAGHPGSRGAIADWRIEAKEPSSCRSAFAQLLRIEQPKLLLTIAVTAEACAPGKLEVVWDPLVEGVEAVSCPRCGKPSYEFALNKSEVGCEMCKSSFSKGQRDAMTGEEAVSLTKMRTSPRKIGGIEPAAFDQTAEPEDPATFSRKPVISSPQSNQRDK